jgi:hypothetical protein
MAWYIPSFFFGAADELEDWSGAWLIAGLLVGCLFVLTLAASIVELVLRVILRVKKDEPTWFRRIFGE